MSPIDILRRWPVALAGAVVAVALVGALFAMVPTERIASFRIQLLFEGVDQVRYPNRMPYSPADVVEAVVVQPVYERLGLERFGALRDIVRALYVSQSNPQVEAINAAHRAALSDPRLSTVDRKRLEDQYRAKLDSVAGEPELTVGFRQPAGVSGLDDATLRDLLEGVVAEWAASSGKLRGATRYDMDVFGPSAVTAVPEGAELLVGIDVVRSALARIRRNLNNLSRRPQFASARLEDEGVSFGDIQAEVNDLLQYSVEPLLREGVAAGVAQNATAVRAYYAARRDVAEFEQRRVRLRIAGLEQALRDYTAASMSWVSGGAGGARSEGGTTLMPQVSEAFLDRLITMASQEAEVEFRQNLTNDLVVLNLEAATLDREVNYYTEAEQLTRALRGDGSAVSSPALASLRVRLDAAAKAASSAAGRAERLYLGVSSRSLEPPEGMYRKVTEVDISTMRATSFSRFGALAVVALGGALLLGAGIDILRRRRA